MLFMMAIIQVTTNLMIFLKDERYLTLIKVLSLSFYSIKRLHSLTRNNRFYTVNN